MLKLSKLMRIQKILRVIVFKPYMSNTKQKFKLPITAIMINGRKYSTHTHLNHLFNSSNIIVNLQNMKRKTEFNICIRSILNHLNNSNSSFRTIVQEFLIICLMDQYKGSRHLIQNYSTIMLKVHKIMQVRSINLCFRD